MTKTKNRKSRETLVSDYWKKYYTRHKGHEVTNVLAFESRKKDGEFYAYNVIVYMRPHHCYNFMYYKNFDDALKAG